MQKLQLKLGVFAPENLVFAPQNNELFTIFHVKISQMKIFGAKTRCKTPLILTPTRFVFAPEKVYF